LNQTQTRRKLTVFGATALAVLLLDQLSKFWIRTTPDLHSYTLVDGWLAFNYTKNPGMALGIHWADTWIISLVAIAATVIILVYVWKTMKPAGIAYMACMGLIVGGALGNITDRFFMARVGGYGGVLDGHVVDFIHFKLRIGNFDVFPYIFNVADMAISVAIITLIIFYKKLMPEYAGIREDADGGPDTSDKSQPRDPKE
jgi:signal peptidase II